MDALLSNFFSPPVTRIRQHGQGAVEFLLAAVPVLLIGLSSIEAIHWYFARQAVSLALMQAGRAAITQHANPVVLDQAFTEALLPMYAGPTPEISRQRLQRAMSRREQATSLPAWNINIVSPSQDSFQDFASHNPELPQTGHAIIDNDYLQEQHQARLGQGWPQGRGPASRQTTLEANTLTLHLTWLHEPLLPGVRQVLRQIAPRDGRYGSQAMARAGFLPMQRTIALVMQSHPVAWPLPAQGRIQRATHSAAPHTTQPGSATTSSDSDSGAQQGSSTTGPDPDFAGQAPSAAGPDGSLLPASPTYLTPPDPTHDMPSAVTDTAYTDTTRPCTGLWCLRNNFLGEHGADSGGQTDLANEAPAQTTQPDTGSSPVEAGYLESTPGDSGNSTEPADADDCPGCCD